MPLPTRAAKRRAGFYRGTAGACGASRWAAGGYHASLVERLASDGERRDRGRWPNRRGRRRARRAARAAARAARPPRASSRSTRAARPSSATAAVRRGRARARRAPRQLARRLGVGARRAGARSAGRARPGAAAARPPARARPARASARVELLARSRSGGCRSLRWRSSPAVCGPRSISTVSSASCGSVRPSAWSSRCLYLTERAVDQLASVVHLRRPRRSSAERTVASS